MPCQQFIVSEDDMDVLLVPTRDWPECQEVHFNNTGYSAIENGYSVVMANYDGITFVRDGYGRLYAYSKTEIVGLDLLPWFCPYNSITG